MRNRPLCSICLFFALAIIFATVCGREKFVKELGPSAAERYLKEGDTVLLKGRVYQKADKEKYQVLYLKDNFIEYHQQSLKESKIIIYDEGAGNPDIGDTVLVQGEIGFFENARNPGNYDMKLYYQKQDIHASVWASSVRCQEKNKRTLYEKVKNRLYGFRHRWKENLCGILGEKDGNTLSAMLLGEKSQMDEELRELYQTNGIGHILAISGLHLSFVGLGMYQLFRRMCGSYAVGGAAGILFLSLYIVMIGITISALRAMIMFLFRVGADITGRNYDSMTALSFSAAVVLIWRPLSVYDGGFWLSFGAVFAVIVVLPAFRDFFAQGIWASVSISLVVLPALLYYFFEFPVYSVILNLFVIPMMSAVLFLGIAGSIIYSALPSVGGIILKACRIIFLVYEQSCHAAVKLPGARLVTGQPEIWQAAVYYLCLGGALFAYSRIRRGKKRETKESCQDKAERERKCGQHAGMGQSFWRYHVPLALLLTGIFLLTLRPGERGKLSVTVLDVGQGDGLYIRGPEGGRYFIDGGSSDVKKVGKYRIEPFLKSQGVKELDYVFISHGDSDHISGIEEMLERKETGVGIKTLVLPVRKVWDESLICLAKKALDNGTKVSVMEQGNVLYEGGMSLSCLFPDKHFSGETGNAASMSLLLSYGEFDMLFTGDVEGAGEEALTENIKEYYGEKSFEVLKAAHHGSKNSTAEEFLKEVNPEYTVISAGINNRYGHPHKETIDRLCAAHSKIFSTQDCGAVTIEVENKRYHIKCFR